jgi:CobW/HypB/UreG, nucleotide-binding domain
MTGPPTLALVGGMLGAGKTTLILAASRRLAERGRRAVVITNKQGGGLVDTAAARAAGVPVREVAGGCFCCRLSDLLDAAAALRQAAPDVIFAEPVGSCLDLAATVLRPLLRDESHSFRIAPLTVLVDPARAREVAETQAGGDLQYLFTQQLAEADLVCFTKADRWRDPPVIAGVAGHRLSALTGEGLDAWLDLLLADGGRPGAALISVDYARYAEAEAALAWLNWRVRLDLTIEELPAVVVGRLLEDLDAGIASAGLEAIHIKVLDQASTGVIRASLVSPGADPQVDGSLDASGSRQHDLLINARAFGDPVALSGVVAAALTRFGGDAIVERREAFRPARPRPERRA